MTIYILSLAAGVLAALSPCVLPILPIMVGSSTSSIKAGPVFLALGMVASLTFMGIAFSSMTSLIGLSEEQVRLVSIVMLLLFGTVLLVPYLKDKVSEVFQRISNHSLITSHAIDSNSWFGQFAIGGLLGAAWSPCVGPTLGIALGLAGLEGSKLQATGMMLVFGVGLSLPLLAIAYGFKSTLLRRKKGLIFMNQYGSKLLGASVALIAALMLTGLDKKMETYVVNYLPNWFLSVSSHL